MNNLEIIGANTIVNNLLPNEQRSVSEISSVDQKISAQAISLLSLQEHQMVEPALYMGKLGVKWQSPSDHLPVGILVDGFLFAIWNVLNPNFLNWTIEDSNKQGLNGSLIETESKKKTELDGISQREVLLKSAIHKLLNREKDAVAGFCLQECNEAFISFLNQGMSSRFSVIRCFDQNPKDFNQNIVIFDATKFGYDPANSQIIPRDKVFSVPPPGPLMSLSLIAKKTQKKYRLINAHLPGKPGNPAPREFINFIKRQVENDPNVTLIACGDMNTSRKNMNSEASSFKGLQQFAPYPTIVDYNDNKAYNMDQFFVSATEKTTIYELEPQDLTPGVAEMVKILRTPT